MTPDVSAVVIAYRSAAFLPSCLDALDAAAGGVSLERIVVDNGSDDGAGTIVTTRGGIRLLVNERNRGFAAAANQGARAARAPFVLFLNPDARLAPASLALLLAALRGRANAGFASPCLLFPDGRPQPSAWLEPSLAMLAFEALLLRNLRPRSRFDHLTPPEAGGPIEVPVIAGTCLLARRSSLDQLGGFDESFFLYYEDWDLCLRARRVGWLSLLVPAATAVHQRGGSAFLDRADFWRRFHESRDLLIRKHFRGGRRPLAQLLHRFGIALHAAASHVAGRPQEGRHLFAALRALTSGVRP
jgi:GT2 family glycosyltransferase